MWGSILRTAAAAGFTQVIALTGCAHLWSSKVLRAGMGAHRLLDLYEGWSIPQVLSAVTAPLLATTADGELDLFNMPKVLIHPVAWVMGSEGQGVSEDLMAQAKGVSIPIDSSVESLNVSTAAAICLFENRGAFAGVKKLTQNCFIRLNWLQYSSGDLFNRFASCLPPTE